jgi:hypothetical protein
MRQMYRAQCRLTVGQKVFRHGHESHGDQYYYGRSE